jgi:hypothetical protein
MIYDESKHLKTLHMESEKFSISIKQQKQRISGNDELLTGWEDTPNVYMQKAGKNNSPLKKGSSCKRPKTQTPKNMFRRKIEQRKGSAEEKILTLEEDKKLTIKELEKIYMGGFISITPKVKNFMLSLNKAKINRMRETIKRNKEKLNFEGSIRIQSVSPFSRMNTLNETAERNSRKSSFNRPYSRSKEMRISIFKYL